MVKKLDNIFNQFEEKSPNQVPTDKEQQLKESFVAKYEKKYKKPTVNDTHTRTTFLLRNDLAERVNKLSEGKRGFKTEFLNTAIEQMLNVLESESE